jgi:hypothetical protein
MFRLLRNIITAIDGEEKTAMPNLKKNSGEGGHRSRTKGEALPRRRTSVAGEESLEQDEA